ncbi:MAG TPA: hypothetical protein ENJ37_05310 [Deltaproteobacteria bacterium]|nr:hypothetical protein [Deltaproteobacteria bacterium]
MTLRGHVIQAAITAAAAATVLDPWQTLVLASSVVLIDVDHYLDFVVVTGRFGLSEMFRFHDFVWERRGEVYGLSVFHTVEVFSLLAAAGWLWSEWAWVVLAGFLMHMAADAVFLYRNDALGTRAVSIVEYVVRRGGAGYPRYEDAEE